MYSLQADRLQDINAGFESLVSTLNAFMCAVFYQTLVTDPDVCEKRVPFAPCNAYRLVRRLGPDHPVEVWDGALFASEILSVGENRKDELLGAKHILVCLDVSLLGDLFRHALVFHRQTLALVANLCAHFDVFNKVVFWFWQSGNFIFKLRLLFQKL